MSLLTIALAQVNLTVGDFAGNADKVRAFYDRARDQGSDLVAFPEFTISGYPPEDLVFKASFIDDCREALAELSKEITYPAAILGFPDHASGSIYNQVAVIENGKIAGIYRKVELPNYGVFDEKRYFTPGNKWLALELKGLLVMLTICEDIWVEDGWAVRNVKEIKPAAVINVSASPFCVGKLSIRKKLVADFARRTGSYLCYNNLVGGQDELVYDGGSMVSNPQGEIIAMARRFEEDLLVVAFELEPRPRSRDLKPEIAGQGRILTIGTKGSSSVFKAAAPHPSSLPEEMSPVEEVCAALILGLRDYAAKNGFKQAVIGLSGGIDSSLTAALAVSALGRENVIGVTMPSQFNSQETQNDAAALARNLGISLISLPIAGLFSAYERELQETLGPGPPGLEFENLQARIRGNLLMTLSNRFGWLVLATGNKSEIAVGYSTLYGDMAGGFAPIKDLFKTEVYELAEHVNRLAGREAIPRSVLERAPSAELRPGQKDEDSLPPYPVLDPVLRAYVEDDKSPAEIKGLGFDPDTVDRVAGLVDRNEYKRRQAPPGIRISPKAFGRDRRLPISNRYRHLRIAR